MEIRKYKSTDCEEIIRLFYNTVHDVNIHDYTKDQLNVWAPQISDIDIYNWNKSLERNNSYVAIKDNIIVGFGDINSKGYLDRLYVHKAYQREGIASAICNVLEESICGVTKIETHSSITAKPFFENRGYIVVREQQVERNNIYLTNYIMNKIIN